MKLFEEMWELEKERDALLRIAVRASMEELNLEERIALVEELQNPLERLWSRTMYCVKYPLLREAENVATEMERVHDHVSDGGHFRCTEYR